MSYLQMMKQRFITDREFNGGTYEIHNFLINY